MANRKNPWVGVNPFLNSLLQTPGTDNQPALWHTFHYSFVATLVQMLNQQLPENYTAFGEQSLQLREISTPSRVKPRRPEPDVTIFHSQTSSSVVTATPVLEPTWEAELVEIIDEEAFLRAVVIREQIEQYVIGKPVSRIELLSPANKPGGSNDTFYQIKRAEAIQTNIPLIEIDLLHETRSPITRLPVYPDEQGSYPYYVALSYPRPNWQQGHVVAYGFRAGSAIPELVIPLAHDEHILFNYDLVYQATFELGKWANYFTYEQPPVRFETYRDDDRAAISRFMENQKGGSI